MWQATLKLNPFTHLAITYQEILFFKGPVGHLKLAAGARRDLDRVLPVLLLGVRPAAGYVRGGSLSWLRNAQLPAAGKPSRTRRAGIWRLEAGS